MAICIRFADDVLIHLHRAWHVLLQGVVKFEPTVANEEGSISFQLPSEVVVQDGQVNTQEMVEQLLSPQVCCVHAW